MASRAARRRRRRGNVGAAAHTNHAGLDRRQRLERHVLAADDRSDRRQADLPALGGGRCDDSERPGGHRPHPARVRGEGSQGPRAAGMGMGSESEDEHARRDLRADLGRLRHGQGLDRQPGLDRVRPAHRPACRSRRHSGNEGGGRGGQGRVLRAFQAVRRARAGGRWRQGAEMALQRHDRPPRAGSQGDRLGAFGLPRGCDVERRRPRCGDRRPRRCGRPGRQRERDRRRVRVRGPSLAGALLGGGGHLAGPARRVPLRDRTRRGRRPGREVRLPAAGRGGRRLHVAGAGPPRGPNPPLRAGERVGGRPLPGRAGGVPPAAGRPHPDRRPAAFGRRRARGRGETCRHRRSGRGKRPAGGRGRRDPVGLGDVQWRLAACVASTQAPGGGGRASPAVRAKRQRGPRRVVARGCERRIGRQRRRTGTLYRVEAVLLGASSDHRWRHLDIERSLVRLGFRWRSERPLQLDAACQRDRRSVRGAQERDRHRGRAGRRRTGGHATGRRARSAPAGGPGCGFDPRRLGRGANRGRRWFRVDGPAPPGRRIR